MNRFIRGACTLKLADLCLSLDLFDIISDFRCVCMMFIRGKHPILNMFIRKTNLLQSSFWTCMYRYVEYKCSLDKGKRNTPYWYALLFNIRMAVRKNEMDNSCCSYMYIIIFRNDSVQDWSINGRIISYLETQSVLFMALHCNIR